MQQADASLRSAITTVPAGAWGVGVSGGADSVALLALLRERSDISLHVVHLDHETRGGASAEDAAFVAKLAADWGLPCAVARLSEMSGCERANASAHYRAARFALFGREVAARRLQGVILAHHADDQAETVLHRLLRGSSAIGLGGIAPQARVDGLTVLHPLLGIRRRTLRDALASRGISWREDASNASPRFMRNKLRVLLNEARLSEAMIDLGSACGGLRVALDAASPRLADVFTAATIQHFPPPLARHAARRWLIARGADPVAINAQTVERLIAMARDAASPPRQHFPGALLVRRRGGKLFVDASPRR